MFLLFDPLSTMTTYKTEWRHISHYSQAFKETHLIAHLDTNKPKPINTMHAACN